MKTVHYSRRLHPNGVEDWDASYAKRVNVWWIQPIAGRRDIVVNVITLDVKDTVEEADGKMIDLILIALGYIGLTCIIGYLIHKIDILTNYKKEKQNDIDWDSPRGT